MSMYNDIQKLLAEIDDAKQEMAEAKGRLSGIKKDLKDITGTDDPKKATIQIDSWEKEAKNLKNDLDNLMSNLRDEYDW